MADPKEDYRDDALLHKLEDEFHDENRDFFDREHIFGAHWRRYLSLKGFLSRSDWTEMLQFPQWMGPIGDIVKRVCVEEKFNDDDIEWLLGVLPPDRFAYDQVLALKMLKEPSLDWEAKLTKAFDLHANWVAQRVLADMPLEHAETARSIVKARKQPKWLLEELDRRLRNASAKC